MQNNIILEIESPDVAKTSNSWRGWLTDFASQYIVTPIKNTFNYVVTYPVRSVVSVASSIPISMYSLTYPSGKEPSQISAQWWSEMSFFQKFFSLVSAISTIITCTSFAQKYIPDAQKSIRTMFDSPRSFIKNVTAILLGSITATIAVTLSYFAFSWAGTYAGLGAAFVGFALQTLTRYVGIVKLTKMLTDFFDKDKRLTKKNIDQLKHLKNEYINQVANLIDNKELTETEVKSILDNIYLLANQVAEQHPGGIFNEKTNVEYAKEYAGLLFDIAFVGSNALSLFPYFTQLSFLGANQLYTTLTGQAPLDTLPNSAKITVGLIPSITSSIFYLISLTHFRHMVVEMAQHLQQNPKDIPKAMMWLVANTLTVLGTHNAANFAINNNFTLETVNLQNNEPAKQFAILSITSGTEVLLLDATRHQLFDIKHHYVDPKIDPLIEWLEHNPVSGANYTNSEMHRFFLNAKTAKKLPPQDIELRPLTKNVVMNV